MENTDFEVIILGRGPAGLQAAIHAARNKVKVLVIGKPEQSSIYHAHIENYFGVKNTPGSELIAEGLRQAQESGAAMIDKDCIEITQNDSAINVKLEDGTVCAAKALILALGISRKKLNAPGEEKLIGKGVSYCVDCDANFFKKRPVAVIGNGSAAVTGALLMADYTDTVHLVTAKPDVSMELMEKLSKSNVKIHEQKIVKAINGLDAVTGITLDDDSELKVDGVFIELGAKGVIELAANLGIMMDESFKYIDVNRRQETNIAGIYAAGDICGPPWQAAKAAGEGCVAGLEAAKYAKKFRR